MDPPMYELPTNWHCKPCLKKIKRQAKTNEMKDRIAKGLPAKLPTSSKKEKKTKSKGKIKRKPIKE